MPESKANIIAEIPWNDGSGDKLYVSYDNNEKSQVINITSDYNTGSNPRDLIVTIQTNTPYTSLRSACLLLQLQYVNAFDDGQGISLYLNNQLS